MTATNVIEFPELRLRPDIEAVLKVFDTVDRKDVVGLLTVAQLALRAVEAHVGTGAESAPSRRLHQELCNAFFIAWLACDEVLGIPIENAVGCTALAQGRAAKQGDTTLPLPEIKETKEQLLLLIGCAGDWRAKKAEQYTQDLRHERSAQALRKLHGQVEALPDDHPAFARLARAWGRLIADEDDINEIIKAEGALIGRYGFDGEEAGAEDFLASLLDAALKDELPAGRA